MTQPTTPLPQLKPQEIPLDDPQSDRLFIPSGDKPFLATPAAVALYGLDTIAGCLAELQHRAREHHGLDHLQVFTDPSKGESLWLIEDGPGGAITALLPSDY